MNAVRKSLCFACGGFVALAWVSAQGAARAPVPIPEFAPDGSTSWVPEADDFFPPESGPGPVTFDPARPYVPNFTPGKQPTYRVADIANPILKPWAVEQMKKSNERVLAGGVPFRARERCYPAGVPALLAYSLVEPFYFVQTPRKVTIIDRGNAEVRRVYMNVPHSKTVKPSWYGESVGQYENGDTLVVDTIGLSEKSFVDNYRTPHTNQLHVVERYKLIDDGQRLEVSITVEDPGAFNMPWSAVQRFKRRQQDPLVEQICAENPTDFFNYDLVPIPQAEEPDF